MNAEIVQKSGTWFSYEKERLGQGRDNSIKFLDDNPEIAEEIRNKIRELNNLDVPELSRLEHESIEGE